MKKKNIYIFFVITVSIFLLLLFRNRLFQEEIAIGNQEKLQENKQKWSEIIAKDVNEKKIKLYIDGKEFEKKEFDSVVMKDNLDIFVSEKIFTDALSCAFSAFNYSEVIIQKGNIKVKFNIEDGHININNDVVLIENAAFIEDNQIFVNVTVLENALGYDCRWMAENNSLFVVDNKKNDSILPAKFVYSEVGKMPLVKNQGNTTTCWAFAANTALESSLLPKERYNFSVDNMHRNNGYINAENEGGNSIRAIAYLTAWKGPVLEKDDPYGDGVCNFNAVPVKHIQEVQIIESKNFAAIKKAVFLYGGVQSSIYTLMTSESSTSAYYNKNTNSYCYIGTQRPNHDIVIVGWDDNYSKNNFYSDVAADGAFICMNSWGTGFGDKGLFYISYYDSNIGVNNVVYTRIEGTDNYDNIYQSDMCGWVGQLGYDEETAYFSNVYEIKEDEKLEAVGFYATAKATEYEIYVVKDFKNENSFDNMQFVQKGSFVNAGYYTVDFNEEIDLQKDEKCAVIVKIKTPGAEHPIAIEYRANAATAKVNLEDGIGYISLNGRNWEHVEATKNCNICLKMYTRRK